MTTLGRLTLLLFDLSQALYRCCPRELQISLFAVHSRRCSFDLSMNFQACKQSESSHCSCNPHETCPIPRSGAGSAIRRQSFSSHRQLSGCPCSTITTCIFLSSSLPAPLSFAAIDGLAFLRCTSPWLMLLGVHLSAFSGNFSRSVPLIPFVNTFARLLFPRAGRVATCPSPIHFWTHQYVLCTCLIRLSPCRAPTPLAERLSDKTS